jgi:hypothetical protein
MSLGIIGSIFASALGPPVEIPMAMISALDRFSGVRIDPAMGVRAVRCNGILPGRAAGFNDTVDSGTSLEGANHGAMADSIFFRFSAMVPDWGFGMKSNAPSSNAFMVMTPPSWVRVLSMMAPICGACC